MQILADINEEIDSITIIVTDFNVQLTSIYLLCRQKINMETLAFNDTLDQKNMIDIYRTFHSKTAECTFFPSAHKTLSRIDNILGHKTNLSKFKKIEIIANIFIYHNCMQLEINYKKKTENKKQNTKM